MPSKDEMDKLEGKPRPLHSVAQSADEGWQGSWGMVQLSRGRARPTEAGGG